jgi:N-acetylmuramoyl-L-alanine amidase
LGLKVGRVVIDAGHGGHDTGSIGPTGLREKDLVLDVATRLGKLIQDGMGSEVVYTRSDDTFLSPQKRTRVANASNADLFISVHANSVRDERVRGVETYYLNFTTDSWAMAVASRENAASEHSVHELQDLVSRIALKESVDESREFAAKIQGALHAGLAGDIKGLRNRGVRKAPLIVLIGAKMPSVLAEIGFLSNPKDEKLFKSVKFRQKIAQHIYDGIAAYAETLSHVNVAQKQEVTP